MNFTRTALLAIALVANGTLTEPAYAHSGQNGGHLSGYACKERGASYPTRTQPRPRPSATYRFTPYLGTRVLRVWIDGQQAHLGEGRWTVANRPEVRSSLVRVQAVANGRLVTVERRFAFAHCEAS